MSEDGETIPTAGILISPAGIKPISGNLATLVKTEDIQEIIVRYGFLSAHPFIQLAIGGAFSLLPIYSVIRIFFWAIHGGTIFEAEISLITSGISVYGFYLMRSHAGIIWL